MFQPSSIVLRDCTNQAAVLVSPSWTLSLQTRLIPIPGPHQLLIQTKAIAINPADWKMQEKNTHQPCILGSDVAGVVVGIGSDVAGDQFHIGDRVTAFAGGAWTGKLDEGAFQSFVVVSSDCTTLVPPTMSYERAATLPMAAATAASALWTTLQLPRQVEGTKLALKDKDAIKGDCSTGILIYGASAAVGLFAIQMARLAGLTVFAVASSKHNKYVCQMGAHHFIAREEKDVGKTVLAAMKTSGIEAPLLLALDAVSNKDSLTKAVEILQCCSSPSQGERAKLAITLDWPNDLDRPQDILIERTSASHFHTNKKNAQWLFHEYLPAHLHQGTITPAPPIRIMEGGLNAVDEALRICKQGLSCEKLVVPV